MADAASSAGSNGSGAFLARFPSRIMPVKALAAGVKLLLNKEDTQQLLVIFDAIDGPQNERNFQRFCATKAGRKMVDDKVDFAEILARRELFGKCPPGSLGAAYFEFTETEQIDAQGLALAEQKANARMLRVEPVRRRYIASGIALHDFWHVLTGYGRDALGEACVLAFTAAQVKTNGIGLFASALAVREQIMFPRIPVLRCVGEARRLARGAEWLPAQDWRELFDSPIDAVRRALGVGRPALYERFAAKVRAIDKVRRDRLAAKGAV